MEATIKTIAKAEACSGRSYRLLSDGTMWYGDESIGTWTKIKPCLYKMDIDIIRTINYHSEKTAHFGRIITGKTPKEALAAVASVIVDINCYRMHIKR